MISNPAAKRSRSNSYGQTGQSRYFKPQDTWTHDFIFLANHEQRFVPTRIENIKLQNAGLGRRRITFHKKDNATNVKQKLEAAYPRLAAGGGFEILRSGLSPKDLYLITQPSSCGYTASFLRDTSGLGQAIAHIRPIQADLDTTPIETTAGNDPLQVKLSYICTDLSFNDKIHMIKVTL